MKSAFGGHFSTLQRRSVAEGRDTTLREFVQALMVDEGLVNLAEAQEMTRLDEALASLDTYKSEVSHFTWEGFLGLLGDALDGAVYEKGTGFVVPDEDHGKTLGERTEDLFEKAMRDLDDIASRDASMPPSPRTGGSREDLRKQLKVANPREYGVSEPKGMGHSAHEVLEIEGFDETVSASKGGKGSEERMRAIQDSLENTKRELEAVKAGHADGGGGHAYHATLQTPAALTLDTSATDPLEGLNTRMQTGLQVSDAVEKRMNAQLREADSASDGYLRKGSLSREQEDEVDEAFEGDLTHEVLVSAFNADITRRDIACLRPLTWLNDEVVNMYMNLLMSRDKELCSVDNSRRRSHYFSSFFLTKLLGDGQYNYMGVRRWTRKIKVFDVDKIFCPVNISNAHWCMAVIYVQDKRINYYDSMGGAGRSVTRALLMWLEDEDDDKNKDNATFDPDEWTLAGTSLNETPQQENGSDCGAFALAFASYVSDDLRFDFRQADVTQMRRRMAWSILHQQLV